ncbi:BgTH12-04226 [Blumeria graminis f. sp. triticale]|uniref:BgTH12-04226 n=1 Tax=Blumeria graminis f. sp. triticale TaxID=1689686 RepID=A0A9W4GD65_BLUGR|nr:BgTH12-04226 [Blumeria graminis f. sp. triticale]
MEKRILAHLIVLRSAAFLDSKG